MLIQIPAVLDAEQVREFQEELGAAHWSDGRGSAGYLSQQVKRNRQLPDDDPLSRRFGELIMVALGKNAQFMSAALPLRILPPRFNCYEAGQHYGRHVDGSIQQVHGMPQRVRTDLSATLFVSDPASYDGGELLIDDTYGSREVKLAAGDLVLYPGTSVHQVKPVTRGKRIAAFFWIQSMVRTDQQRVLLYELDRAIQAVAVAGGIHNAAAGPATELAGVYHNLLRMWAEL